MCNTHVQNVTSWPLLLSLKIVLDCLTDTKNSPPLTASWPRSQLWLRHLWEWPPLVTCTTPWSALTLYVNHLISFWSQHFYRQDVWSQHRYSSRVVVSPSSQPISHPPEFCLWYMYEWCDLEWGRPRVKGYKYYHHLSRKGESSVFLKTVWPPLVTKDFAGASPPVPPPLMIRWAMGPGTASRARPSS